MPTISSFYGILIMMYWADHQPPHFHARYGEHKVSVEIGTLTILKGRLPRRAMALVLEWAQLHREELMEAWDRCVHQQPPRKIRPLG